MDALQRWLTLVTLVAAALAALGFIVRMTWKGFRVVERVHELVDHELTPNDGSSMRDDVAAIAVAVGELQRDFHELRRDKAREHEAIQGELHSLARELGIRLVYLPTHKGDT